MCGTHTGRARPRPLGYKLIIACPDGLLQLGRIRVQPLPHVTGSVNIPLASTQHGEQTSLVLLNASEFARLWRRSLRKPCGSAAQPTRPTPGDDSSGGETNRSVIYVVMWSIARARTGEEAQATRIRLLCSSLVRTFQSACALDSTRRFVTGQVAEDQGRKDESAYRKARP
jgi:hypothetical protein